MTGIEVGVAVIIGVLLGRFPVVAHSYRLVTLAGKA